jgi:polyketide synthase PksN
MVKGKLQNVAALWVLGADIDWELFREGNEKRISLPTYPFVRRKCWFHPNKQNMDRIDTVAASRAGEVNLVSPVSHSPDAGNQSSRAISENRPCIVGASSADSPFSLHSSTNEIISGDATSQPPLRSRDDARLEKNSEETLSAEKARMNEADLNLAAIERDVKKLVGEVLYLEGSEIDIRKKFVDMGLNSIIGVELVRELNERYGLNVRATRFYDHPNIVELAKFIHEAITGGSDGVKVFLPRAGTPNGELHLGLHSNNGAADSIEEKVRDVLKQLTANDLTLDDAEQLFTNSFQSFSSNTN